jgi:hypothetical protein
MNKNRGNDGTIIREDTSGARGPSTLTLQRLKQEIAEEMKLLIEEHRTQSVNSLREGLIKINDNMKKECLTLLSRSFLPVSYLDDSEQQFLDLSRKISKLELKLQGIESEGRYQEPLKLLQQTVKKHAIELEQFASIVKQI